MTGLHIPVEVWNLSLRRRESTNRRCNPSSNALVAASKNCALVPRGLRFVFTNGACRLQGRRRFNILTTRPMELRRPSSVGIRTPEIVMRGRWFSRWIFWLDATQKHLAECAKQWTEKSPLLSVIGTHQPQTAAHGLRHRLGCCQAVAATVAFWTVGQKRHRNRSAIPEIPEQS